MDRMCEVDDVIKGPFEIGRVDRTGGGLLHHQVARVKIGNEWRVTKTKQWSGDDGYEVTAVMLTPNGKKESQGHNGETYISFYQTGWNSLLFKPEDIELTGQFGHTTEKQRIR